jgi:hypothetical protein
MLFGDSAVIPKLDEILRLMVLSRILLVHTKKPSIKPSLNIPNIGYDAFQKSD